MFEFAGGAGEEIEGGTEKLNDEFNYHYKDVHKCKMKITEFIPGKKVVWHVLDNHFSFSVRPNGELPMGGVLPCVIDVGDNPPTAKTLKDQGVRLREFFLDHPNKHQVNSLYQEIGIANPTKS